MRKKQYEKPAMRAYELKQKPQLLSGSATLQDYIQVDVPEEAPGIGMDGLFLPNPIEL